MGKIWVANLEEELQRSLKNIAIKGQFHDIFAPLFVKKKLSQGPIRFREIVRLTKCHR